MKGISGENMKKNLNKVKNFIFLTLAFLLTNIVAFGAEAQNAANAGSGLYTALGAVGGGGGGGGGGGSSPSSTVVANMITKFRPIVDFLMKFRGIIIIIFALIVGIVIIISIIKQISNPDLTQIIITALTIILAIFLVFGFYALIDDVAGTELPVRMITNSVGMSVGL
jgi:hypothetical protein